MIPFSSRSSSYFELKFSDYLRGTQIPIVFLIYTPLLGSPYLSSPLGVSVYDSKYEMLPLGGLELGGKSNN